MTRPLRLALLAWASASFPSGALAATPFFEFEMGRGEQGVRASETELAIVLDGAL